jgi:hypothetical protein
LSRSLAHLFNESLINILYTLRQPLIPLLSWTIIYATHPSSSYYPLSRRLVALDTMLSSMSGFRRISPRYISLFAIAFVALWTLYSLYYEPDPHHRYRFGALEDEEPIIAILPAQYTPQTAENWTTRADAVRDAFVHAYTGYERVALAEDGSKVHDELRPLTNWPTDPYV